MLRSILRRTIFTGSASRLSDGSVAVRLGLDRVDLFPTKESVRGLLKSQSIVVIDNSGSMAGAPIALCNAAVRDWYQRAREVPMHDMHLVSFSDDVVSYPLPQPNDESREHRLPAIEVQGMTNFAAMLRDLHTRLMTDRTQAETTILIVTDGQNTGPDTEAPLSRLQKVVRSHGAGVAIHVVGVSPEHDAVLLQRIKQLATASSSFNYAQNEVQMAAIIPRIAEIVADRYAKGILMAQATLAGFEAQLSRVQLEYDHDEDRFTATAIFDGQAIGAADVSNSLSTNQCSIYIPKLQRSLTVPLQWEARTIQQALPEEVLKLTSDLEKKVIDVVPTAIQNPVLEQQVKNNVDALYGRSQALLNAAQQQASEEPSKGFRWSSLNPFASSKTASATDSKLEQLSMVNQRLAHASQALKTSPLSSWSNQALGVFFTASSVFVGAALLTSMLNSIATNPAMTTPLPDMTTPQEQQAAQDTMQDYVEDGYDVDQGSSNAVDSDADHSGSATTVDPDVDTDMDVSDNGAGVVDGAGDSEGGFFSSMVDSVSEFFSDD
jgi:uncharacterized protein YegL